MSSRPGCRRKGVVRARCRRGRLKDYATPEQLRVFSASGKCQPAGGLSLKPMPAALLSAGDNACGAADDPTEAATEVEHGFDPAVGVDRKPLENWTQMHRNGAAFVGAYLPTRPIE